MKQLLGVLGIPEFGLTWPDFGGETTLYKLDVTAVIST